MKKVYCVCGSGVATSTMIASKVKNYLASKGIDADVETTNFGAVNSGGISADVLVSTNPNIDGHGIPVVGGMALLTGMGEEAVLEKVYEILKD